MQQEIQKKMFYTPQNGFVLGLVGVLTPIVATLIIALLMVFIAFGAGEGFEKLFDSPVFVYITQVLCEGAFVLALFIFNKKTNTNFVSAGQLKTKPKYLNWAVAIVIGIAMPMFLNPIISLWEQLLALMGIKISGLNIPFSTGLDLALAILVMGLLPAFCEEMLFRGGVLNGLRDKGVWFAVLYSAMCFALMHGNLQQLPYTFVLGLVIGYVVYYTRSVWLGVLIHACNNTTVLVAGFLAGSGETSALTGADIIYAMLMTLVGVALIVGTMVFTKKYNQPKTVANPMLATPPQTTTKNDSFALTMTLVTVLVGIAIILINIFN